jgi:hypothetical protein
MTANTTIISNVQIAANTTTNNSGNATANITTIANTTSNITANVSANVSSVANTTANTTTNASANTTTQGPSRYEAYIAKIQNDLTKPAPKVEKSVTELAIPDYDSSGVDIKFVDTSRPDILYPETVSTF